MARLWLLAPYQAKGTAASILKTSLTPIINKPLMKGVKGICPLEIQIQVLSYSLVAEITSYSTEV